MMEDEINKCISYIKIYLQEYAEDYMNYKTYPIKRDSPYAEPRRISQQNLQRELEKLKRINSNIGDKIDKQVTQWCENNLWD